MKDAWELKFEDGRWAAVTSGTVIILLNAFVYAFFSQAGPSFTAGFSKAFSLEVDLSECAHGFAVMIMSQIVYALLICLLLFSFALRMIVAAARNGEHRKELLTLAVAPLFFVLIIFALGAAADHGFWLSHIGRSLGHRIKFLDACRASHQTSFFRLYMISGWLSVFTWLIMLINLLLWRQITLHRDYEEMPRNPLLRAEILKIRTKFGTSGNIELPQVTKLRSISLIVTAVGLIIAIVSYQLYHGIIALGVP